jgi:hypothetical protein
VPVRRPRPKPSEWAQRSEPALNLATLWSELFGFALAIAFSPLHIALLLLLLVGTDPLRRGGWFVAGWLLVSVLEVALLLTVGHGLLLSMDKGTSHRTGLDLLAAGVLLGVGMKQLLDRKEDSGPPPWAGQLDRFCAMPLLPLLATPLAVVLLVQQLLPSLPLLPVVLLAVALLAVVPLLPLQAVLAMLLQPFQRSAAVAVAPLPQRRPWWKHHRQHLLAGLTT